MQRQSNGDVIFVERADEQIKIRGFRVETIEIENIIKQLSKIKSVRVILSKTNNLLAYIVLKNHEQIEIATIRNYCRKKLPYYMIPTDYIFLEALPLTKNSKIDFKKLPEFESKKVEKTPNIDKNGQKLIKIISNVLNIDTTNIDLNDSFIYIGGNSLNGQRILNQFQNEYQLKFNLTDLLNPNKTISNLIKTIFEQNSFKLFPFKLDFNKIPLSCQQEQMFYLSHLDSIGYYNLPFIQKFNSKLILLNLHEAFMQILQTHSILRSRLREEKKNYDLFVEQLSITEVYFHLPKKIKILNSRQELCFELRKICTKKFDFFANPALKCHIYEFNGEYILLLLMHHILSDGKSTQIIEREIHNRYKQINSSNQKQIDFFHTNSQILNTNDNKIVDLKLEFKNNEQSDFNMIRDFENKNFHSNLIEKNSYAKWSIQQKAYLDSDEFKQKILNLRERLLPCLKNRIKLEQIYLTKTSNELTKTYFDIPIEQFNLSGYTPYIIFTAIVLKSVVNAWSQNKQIENYLLIGSPFNNRTNETENIVGNFLNNIILTFSLEKIKRFKSIYEYLGKVLIF